MSQATLRSHLLHFLQHEMSIPAEAIAIARREEALFPNLLPIILWQYGVVNLEQLEQILDWLDTVQAQAGSF
jgi:hypothetical protein